MFEGVVEPLLDRELVARLKVGNVSLTRTGGYNARPYSRELGIRERPRVQALKGVWRWWARALLAGAYHDKFKELPESLRDVDARLVSPIMGDTSSSSKFVLRVSDIKTVPEARGRGPGVAKEIARLRLFRPPRDRDERELYIQEESPSKYFEGGQLEFTLELLRRPHSSVKPEEERFALLSLALSLTLGGIGSMTNRGFGSVRLDIVDGGRAEAGRILSDLLDGIYKAENHQALQERLKKLVGEALGAAGGCVRPLGVKGVAVGLPPYPLISEGQLSAGGKAYRWFKLEVARKAYGSPTEALVSIGNATLKSTWKTIRKLKWSALGGHFHTWILGLPRSTFINNVKTGYFIKGKRPEEWKEEDVRRQSAIGFSIIPSRGRYYIAIYGFLTSDWLSLLNRDDFVHVGVGTPVKSLLQTVERPSGPMQLAGGLDVRHVAEAFEAAWAFVRSVLP